MSVVFWTLIFFLFTHTSTHTHTRIQNILRYKRFLPGEYVERKKYYNFLLPTFFLITSLLKAKTGLLGTVYTYYYTIKVHIDSSSFWF